MRRAVPVMLLPMLLLAACNGDDADLDAPEANDAEDTEDAEDADDAEDGDYSVDDQPADAVASFVSPSDGDTVSAPVEVELAADGVELAPAGAPAVGEGHFHVTVDLGCYDEGEVIPGPSDEDEEEGRFHLGDGSDARTLDLEPGTYELCAQLADGVHTAFGQTETIEITVE
jgi:hypothetical protein